MTTSGERVGRRSVIFSGVAGLVGLGLGAVLGMNLANPRTTQEIMTVTRTLQDARTVTQTVSQVVTTTLVRETTLTQMVTPTQQKIMLKIGDTRGIGRAPFYVALEKKILDDFGLQYEVFETGGSGQSIEALVSGTVDIAPSDMASAMRFADRTGRYLKIVHPNAIMGTYKMRNSNPNLGLVIVVKKDSDINRLADLEGKRVAVNILGGVPHICTSILLRRAGVDPSSRVNWIEITFSRMAEALATGQIDAAVMLDPFPTFAIQRGIGRVLVDPPILNQGNIYFDTLGNPTFAAAFFTTEENLSKNPEGIYRFMQAYAEGVRHYYGDLEETYMILSKYFNMPIELLSEALSGGIMVPFPNGFNDVEILRPQMEVLVQEKFLSKPLEMNKFIIDWQSIHKK